MKKQLILKHWYLLIIPSLFVFLAAFFHANYGTFYQNSTDPEYTLLYNGIVVSTGSFAINFIHHPATPTIFIAGLSSLLLRPFAEYSPFVIDFIKRPEFYLTAANLMQLLIIGAASFLAALKVRSSSRKIIYSFFLLLGLFSHHHLLSIASRFLAETTLIIPLVLLVALISSYIFEEGNQAVEKKLRWQIPLLIGFGIACKLSFAPFILVPYVLLVNSWRNFWVVSRNTFLAILLLAYPLFTNFEESFKWISNMLTHSGMHGSGQAGLIKLTDIPTNALTLFQDFPLYWMLFGLNCLLLIYLIAKPAASATVKRLRRSLLSIVLAMLLLLFLTLKHFALHYFMPFYVFSALWFIFPYVFWNELHGSKKKVLNLACVLIGVFMISSTSIASRNHFKTQQTVAEKRAMEAKTINALLDQDQGFSLIVDAPYWGTPFPAYAHAFGFMHSYRRKTYFKKQLREEFPNFYLHVGWTEKFNHWDNFVEINRLFNKSKQLYVYTGPETKGWPSIKQRILAFQAEGKKLEEIELWKNEEGAKLIKWEVKP